jgi:hypothetical protein
MLLFLFFLGLSSKKSQKNVQKASAITFSVNTVHAYRFIDDTPPGTYDLLLGTGNLHLDLLFKRS